MSFINSIFLFGLGAALLPVLYHLVRKLRAKKLPFSSLMFLKSTPKELVRKRRLRDILLMTVRAVMFGLLALVFARPFIPEEHFPLIAGTPSSSTVLLVDNSYSMQYGDVFDRAKQEALDRIDRAGSNDEISVVLFSDVARQMTPLSSEQALHRAAIEQARPGYRATDFYAPLRLASDILADARHEHKEIVLISDMQRGGWTSTLENWKLDPSIMFVPVKVAEEAPENAFVEAFNLTKRRADVRTALRFDARVRATGRLAERAAAVTLTVDNAGSDAQTLPGAASRNVSFQQFAPRAGFFQGSLALEADRLPPDDRYYFTYTVEGRPSLLCIEGGGRQGGYPGCFFLNSAFNLGDDAPYAFTTGGAELIRASELRRHQVVFVAGLPSLSDAQARVLRDYAEDGGTVVFSFGEGANLPAYAAALRTLGAGRVDEVVDARALQHAEAIIGEVELRHPIFNLFAESGISAIFRSRFHRYVRMEADGDAAVLGTYDTGDPMLVERRLGNGKVLVYTSSFNTVWTDLPVSEMFVPLAYQIVRYGLDGPGARFGYTVGDVVPLQGRPGDEWEVRAPGNRLYKVTIDTSGTGVFRETEEPGNYQAAGSGSTFLFSVNVDPRESDLDTRDEEEAFAAVAAQTQDVPRTPAEAATAAVEENEREQKLWRYLLLLVIGLFAFETVYANRKASSAARRRVSPHRASAYETSRLGSPVR